MRSAIFLGFAVTVVVDVVHASAIGENSNIYINSLDTHGRVVRDESERIGEQPEPTISSAWKDSYWPSWGDKLIEIPHGSPEHIPGGNQQLLDHWWQHTNGENEIETQTQLEFVQVTATSENTPTGGFWCDGGYVTITKVGRFLDDDWAIAYIMGYLEVIGLSTEGVESYDWCYNTDKNVSHACWRVNGDTSDAGVNDDTTIITLKVCDMPSLEHVCLGTAENYKQLDGFRIKTVSLTTFDNRDGFQTPCLKGNGDAYPYVADVDSRHFYFCRPGQMTSNFFSNYKCEACPGVEDCLSPYCTPSFSITSGQVDNNVCGATGLGWYVSENGSVKQCKPAVGCVTGQEYCVSDVNSKCAYAGCEVGYLNTATPGNYGDCYNL
eukprot:CFRG2932T1